MSTAEKVQEAEEVAPSTSVYVGNCKFETTEEQLRDAFAKFGEITACRLVKRKDGKSKGFGFIDFAKIEDAQKAVEEMSEKELDGRPLLVRFAKPPRPQDETESAEKGRGSEGRQRGKPRSRGRAH